jgi:hypothetical protein
MRQFVVGTGGKNANRLEGDPAGNSLVRSDDTLGVLRLTLDDGSYDWRFVPVEGSTFGDAGSASCS